MNPRSLSDNKTTVSPTYLMRKGEYAMLVMKAGIAGVGISELIRLAVNKYSPYQKINTCHKCHKKMSSGRGRALYVLNIAGKQQEFILTHIPVQTCECSSSEQTISLAERSNIKELIDLMVLDALKYQKEIPTKMSIEALFGEDYLGKNNSGETGSEGPDKLPGAAKRKTSCSDCGGKMVAGHMERVFPLDLPNEKMDLTIIEVPAMVCKCGYRTYNLLMGVRLTKQVEKMVLDALRYRREIPAKISMDELFEEEYLGKK